MIVYHCKNSKTLALANYKNQALCHPKVYPPLSNWGDHKLEMSIDEKNVITLTPWFHKFSMEAHLKQCDNVLATKAVKISRWKNNLWGKLHDSWDLAFLDESMPFCELLDLLQHALAQTKHELELTVESFLKHKPRLCFDLFDI